MSDTPNLDGLCTPATRPGGATPKHQITPRRLEVDKRKKAKKLTEDEFRDLIWKLDGAKSRATGKTLKRGDIDWHEMGEVDHAIPKSLAPDRIYDPSNALLLSKWENRMRKVPCPRAPEYRIFNYEGPDNRRLPQVFTWRDEDGQIVRQTCDGKPLKLKTRIG